ncbi:uncharacterized protein LOC127871224 isoform X1 [Dreissena polymorpha]|uniref:uncharacterized protein LOC127857653 isoform X1 n=1 Tax=Dreissena polymorpha TaxID=45954 RepID=UPI002263C4B9|nr:uncharacterized protein LOC127857653 isoform X1 [Dreissena polymorpha]XP_052269923.1 uncharacterized protein LOC127871224 isoform X1 [Dreissena polymorpha]
MAFSQLRYQSGALPGKKRKQPTDPVSSKRAYEVKRVRTFQQSWQSGREWLQYDPETQLMRCQLCIEFYGPSSNDNIFIKGSSYLRIDGIQLHENSPNHFKAVQAKQAKSTPKSSSTAAKALKTLRQADYDKLVNKFRNAHAVCKNNFQRVISNLQSLSLYLQTDLISLADAARRVQSSKTAISQLCEKDDSTVSDVSASETYKQEKLVFRGVKAKADQSSLIKEIVENLEARFPTSDLVSATMVSSFKNWPDLTSDEIKDSTFGDKEVETLYRQFEDVAFGKSSEGIALEDVLDQWATLRTLIYHRYPFQDRQKLTWVTVMGSMADQQLYAVFTLIDITLALPPTSVKCETSFSAMKLLKNKRRGRLRAGRLNDVMMVKLTSPSINEFDPDLAIKHWMTSTPSGQPRRIKREAPGSQGDCIVVSEEDEKDVASNKVPENSEYEDDDDDDDDEDMEMSAEHAFSVVLKNE